MEQKQQNDRMKKGDPSKEENSNKALFIREVGLHPTH